MQGVRVQGMGKKRPCEKEALAAHEEALTRIANKEYNQILIAIASGHTPDIIDRILLRMRQEKQGGNAIKKDETREEMIERYSGAVLYFIEHPEAQLDPVLRALVDSVKEEVERGSDEGKQVTLN